MARARQGNSVQTKMGFLIYGTFGSWKSSLCLQFMKMKREDGKPFRVLYIDGESGSVDSYLSGLKEEGIDTRNLYIVYTQSLGEVREYIGKVANNEDLYNLDEDGNETEEVVKDVEGKPFRADAIVVDGTTVIYLATQQGLLEFSKKRARVRADKNNLVGEEKQVAIDSASLEIKDYGTLKFKGQDLILDLLATGKHFAVTARETDEKQTVKGSDGKFNSIATGKKMPDGFKGLDYNVKTVLHTFIDDDGTVKAIVENKDRTLIHKQNEILEEPSLLDWQEVIERNKGKKDFTIINNLKKSVEAEQKIYEKEIDNLSKNAKKNNNEDDDINDLSYYYKTISSIIKSMPLQKKRTLKTTVEKAGFPLKYRTITDIEKLKKYIKIINK